MRKFLLVGLLGFFAMTHYANAQDRTISGKATASEDGSPLPGVNVVVKGTTNGSVTDQEGNYSLRVPSEGATLIFSFIGLVTQEIEVGTRSTIDVTMAQDAKQLGEVVVTAIGIEQSTRKLGYSVGKVEGEDVIRGRASSLLNSLQGKVAGVQISGSSGAPGASNKVIVRGFTSLSGGNNPLYIVDGIPVDNSFTGNTTLNGASDFGNRINDINPEDIESVSILKGAGATSLYGSRAAAGVIIITTKKGKDAAAKGKKSEVSFASSLIFEDILKLPTFQNERGQGFFGSTSRFLNENTSWGSKFDGELHPWGRVVNDQQRVKPFVGLKNNVKEFFETGKTFTNSLALQGGNENSNYYVSYSNVDADGIMPTDVDAYKRHTISVRGGAELSDKVRSSASLNYARSNFSFVPTGQGATVYNYVLQTPRDIPLLELEDINNPFNDLEGYYSEFTNNPWYVLKEFGSKAVIDRLYGNVELNYKANNWLSFTGRLGSDVARTEWEQWIPVAVIEGPNSGNSNPGNYSVQNIYTREINSDLLMNINKDLGTDLNLSAFIGWNVNQREGNTLFSQINDLVIPAFYNLANSANAPTSTTNITKRRLIGALAQATLSFKDYLFLTLSGRNDWSSTLPKNNRSFFYPAANFALDVTSALGIEGNTLSYAKVRAGWAQAGKDANPYQINSVFIQSTMTDGFITQNAPIAQAIPAFEVGNQIGNANLQPEISTDIELGADMKFLNDRVGLDVTLYQRNVKDNILAVAMPASSGYTAQILNIAELSNKGIEILLTGSLVQRGSFSWDVSLNWSKNISRIEDLGGPSQITVGGLGGNGLIARVGAPAFEIEGNAPLRDSQGRIVVNGAGLPRANPTQQVLGNTQYNWIGGVTNKLSYKGLSLAGTFDFRNGGVLYSRTASLVYFSGTTPATLYNDRRPFVIPNSVVQAVDAGGDPVVDDDGNPVYVENNTAINDSNGQLQNYWSAGGSDLSKAFLVSKSYVKLRELVLSYSLPKSIIEKTPFGNVDVSVIGRNLFLWVPSSNVFIDPEQTTFGTDIASEFGEFGASPTTRSYGFNVRLTF